MRVSELGGVGGRKRVWKSKRVGEGGRGRKGERGGGERGREGEREGREGRRKEVRGWRLCSEPSFRSSFLSFSLPPSLSFYPFSLRAISRLVCIEREGGREKERKE